MESKIVSFVKRRPFSFGFVILYFALWYFLYHLQFHPTQKMIEKMEGGNACGAPSLLSMLIIAPFFIMGFLIMTGETKDPQAKKDYKVLALIVGVPFFIFVAVGSIWLYLSGEIKIVD